MQRLGWSRVGIELGKLADDAAEIFKFVGKPKAAAPVILLFKSQLRI